MNRFNFNTRLICSLITLVVFFGCSEKVKENIEETNTTEQQPGPIEQTLDTSEVQMIVENEWPPYTIVSDDNVSGFAVELVREMASRVNHSGELTPMLWAPAYNFLINGTNIGLFCTARTAHREKLVKWVGPMFVNETCLWKRKGSPIEIVKFEDLKEILIGVERDTFVHQNLTKNGANNLFFADSFQQKYEMLVNGRIDLMPANVASMRSYAEEHSGVFSEIEKAYVLQRSGGYLAFSKDVTDEKVQQWQDALDSMKNDGSFSEIYVRLLPNKEIPKDLATPGLFKPHMLK